MTSSQERTPKRRTKPLFSTDEARWGAVQRRDRAADGVFFYSVLTTGVYCRPYCAARLPRRQNVRFFATPAEANLAVSAVQALPAERGRVC